MARVARGDAYLFCRRIECVHRRDVVAIRTALFGVAREFVPEGPRRVATLPGIEHRFIGDLGGIGQFNVEIGCRHLGLYLMTSSAVGRCRGDSRFGRVTRETRRVAEGDGLERAFLQPERIAYCRRRFREIFIRRLTLRLHCLVANRAALLGGCRAAPGSVSENTPGCVRRLADDVDVLVVRERDCEVREGSLPLRRQVENFARIRERVPAAVAWARTCVADRADRRRRSSEELLAVAVQAGLMLRVVGDIRKGGVLSTHLVPVRTWKFMTGSTVHPMGLNVVRELRIPASP